jgi:hypothetical protein
MAIRDSYSNFGFFEMLTAGTYNENITGAGGSASGTAVDTRGFETAIIQIIVGSALNVNPTSNMHVTLMHASVNDSVSFVFVSSSDLFGSDININSAYTVSFGGSMQLGLTAASGVILDMSIPTASIGDANSAYTFGYKGRERYLKLMVDSAGANGGGSMIMTARAILGLPANWPVNDPNP